MKKENIGGIMFTNEDYQAKQIELLLGKKLPKYIKCQIGRLSHLTVGNEWVLRVLQAMGKKVKDIKFPKDREVLQIEFGENKEYKDLF